MFPLNALLRRVIRVGRIRVIDHKGQPHEFGDADAPLAAAVALHHPALPWKLGLYPSLQIGTAYTDGSLTIEEGTLAGLLRVLLRNSRHLASGPLAAVHYGFEELVRLPAVINWTARARRNVKHHYDLSEELFSLFLDADRQYSCAYYRSADDDLDSAQLAKKQHIAAKLLIRPGQHILDIGSGWGGLALYLAQHYDVRVTGLTLSDEQLKLATQRARQLGLADRVTFRLRDYRHEDGVYDRIVSVGMFEHVGRPHYRTFFAKMKALLAEDGVALIHTIGQQGPPSPINPWIRQNIFPGAYLPALSQLTPVFQKLNLWLNDFESLRLHYALTLRDWNQRFQASRAHISRLYDERFCRMWEFYLQSCEAGFRWSGLTVFQLLLTRSIDALPLIRDPIFEEEQRLQALDSRLSGRPRAAIS